MARALGLEQDEVGTMLGWYDAIVAAVTEVTAGARRPDRAAATRSTRSGTGWRR